MMDYQRHLNSVKHANKRRNFNAKDRWNCYICDIQLPNENEWVGLLTSLTYAIDSIISNRISGYIIIFYNCLNCLSNSIY